MVHHADSFLKDYGKDVGTIAQGIAPAVGAVNPTAGIILGAGGKFASEYARVRNEMEP